MNSEQKDERSVATKMLRV